MTYYVYLLRCGDNSLYCGITNDVAGRVAAHAAGKGARYTRGRGPLELVLARRCRDKSTALRLEHAIKQLPRPTKLALDRAQISRLARGLARAPARGPSAARSRASTRTPTRDRSSSASGRNRRE